MLRHSLLLIYRNFRRSKSTFFINLIGLSIGLACVLLIYLWVNDELHFDKYHEKDSRLYQVMVNERNDNGIQTLRETPSFMAEVLADEMPEIEYAAVVTPPAFFPVFTLTVTDHHVKGVGKFAGKDFFTIFSYNLIEGDENQVLSDKNAIVISEKLARSLFNTTQNIVGNTIEWEMLNIKRQATISGVFENVPANSSEHFDFILSFEAFSEIMGGPPSEIVWDGIGTFFTYVTLKKEANIKHFTDKASDFFKSRQVNSRTLVFKPYSDNYLYGKYENGIQTGGRIEYVRLFSFIAIFILIIACVNFMNLSTAKASKRIKEVGIKKVVGAPRRALVFQYLGESLLMAFLALVAAILFVDLLLPQFNSITGKDLILEFDTSLVLSFLGITVVTGLVAGSYPALHLSGFNPAVILKGRFVGYKGSLVELWVRKGLVIFQFAVSVIFIVSVLVVYKQIEFIQTKNLGYDKNNILYFEADGRVAANPDAFLSQVKDIPGVMNASSMVGNIAGVYDGPPGWMEWEGKRIPMYHGAVNYDMLETLGIKMAAGHTFSREFGSDTLKCILNEAAIEALGIKDPLGKRLNNGREIIGVAKNFHFQSLHEIVKPFCFRLEPYYAMTIMVKIKPGSEAETLNKLQKFYKGFNPGFTFDYKFLDQNFQSQYVSEKRVAVLSRYAAGLAILISCLGVFGLAAFTAERRFKEIGIRKILGSSAFGIVYLLSSDLTRTVMISITIALPISYFITRHWLDNFAFKVELEWWYFIGAGLAVLIITGLTVGIQAINAARINPAKCLRDE